MNKETVTALLRLLLRNKRRVFDKRMIHPIRDWFIGVALFLVVASVGGGYSALLFVEYRNIAADESATEDPVVRYNEVLVKNMLKLYQTRSEAYATFTARIPNTDEQESELDASASSSASSTQQEIRIEEAENDTQTERTGAVIAN